MTDLFGARWLETYGDEPSPLWTNQIERLDDAQLKQGISTVLKSGAQHPPSLPEFLAHCRRQLNVPSTYVEYYATPDESIAGRWFVRASLQLRFVGFTEHMALRNRAMELCRHHLALMADNDPEATEERIQGQLDAAAEEIYPRANAVAWLAAHPIVINQEYRA
jgi:hypothetical protein